MYIYLECSFRIGQVKLINNVSLVLDELLALIIIYIFLINYSTKLKMPAVSGLPIRTRPVRLTTK